MATGKSLSFVPACIIAHRATRNHASRITFVRMYLLAGRLWEKLESWDRALFIKINTNWTNSFLDAFFPWMREGKLWIPIYLFLAVFVLLNYKAKGFWWCIFLICTIALADLLAFYGIKSNIERSRPCNDVEFLNQVRLLLKECNGYGFVSNHATNHFSIAAFFFLSFRNVIPKWSWILFIWAFIVIYSQVYVGIHYPGDVICGALLGTAIGLITGNLFNKRYGFAIFDNQPTSPS